MALDIALSLVLRVLAKTVTLGLISRLSTRWHRAWSSLTLDLKNKGCFWLGFDLK